MLLHHEFVRVAKRDPRKLAFIDRATDRRIPYGRALLGALLLTARFRRLDERYLGIMLPTSAGCGLSIIATLMSGKIPVMINYSTGAAKNVEYARHKCGFKTVITSRALLKKIECPETEGMIFVEDMIAGAGPLDKLKAGLKSRLPVGAILRGIHGGDGDSTAVILFTSGSEKDPKAVELTHRNIGFDLHAAADAFDVRQDDVIMAVLPLFHVLGLTTTFWLPICRGLTMVTYANPLEFKTVAGIIRDEKPTFIVGTPYFLMGYLKQAQPGDFASLRVAVAGADKMPEWLQQAYQKQHGVQVYEGYGTTETSPVISVNTPAACKPGSIGRPLPGVQVKIADIDTGDPLPPGKEGKILVKGDLVMKGYLGDVEETVLHIEDGWYETGDMGVLDEDGFLWHRGRLKRFIKIGGEMVSLVQVENELQQLLPEGIECCAVELPDRRKGARVAVAVTRELDRKGVLGGLAERLPSLALPREVVVIEELPKMGSGKIDFRATGELVRRQLGV